MTQDRLERINRLAAALPDLSNHRLSLVEKVIGVFFQPKTYTRSAKSDIFSETSLQDFGDVLKLHHCFSREPFSKDKFEYGLETILKANGVKAELAPRGQRGYDVLIGGKRTSLKTEAAAAIRINSIHISKYMELGGGQWGNDIRDFEGLRDQFLNNLKNTDRILILRAISKGKPDFIYELIEIPKVLLLRSAKGRFEMPKSSQFPRPGYCYVEQNGRQLFSLYFDGGGERKLQIKHLQKDLCLHHATWQFSSPNNVV